MYYAVVIKILEDMEVKTVTSSTVADNTRRIIAEKGLKNGAVAVRAGYSEKQFSAILCKRRAVKDVDITIEIHVAVQHFNRINRCWDVYGNVYILEATPKEIVPEPLTMFGGTRVEVRFEVSRFSATDGSNERWSIEFLIDSGGAATPPEQV